MTDERCVYLVPFFFVVVDFPFFSANDLSLVSSGSYLIFKRKVKSWYVIAECSLKRYNESTSDISLDYAEEMNITIVPAWVRINDKEYKDQIYEVSNSIPRPGGPMDSLQ